MTKLYAWFTWVGIVSGMVMGLCFAFMWVASMYQMWFSPAPSQVVKRAGGDVG